MSYQYSPKRRFSSKRPIRSFRDLDIYQGTQKISVEIMKNIIPQIPEGSQLKKDLAECSMKIPHYIAEAHSRRFDDKEKSMRLLKEVLFLCNKVVVYLEQARDIYSEYIDKVVCDEIIKKYFYVRQKIFNFYKAYKKFE